MTLNQFTDAERLPRPTSGLSFTDTRARSTDPITSREAAKNAAGGKATELRLKIQVALHQRQISGATARELSEILGVDYYDVQRRISETPNIRKTGEVRDGAMVWEWFA